MTKQATKHWRQARAAVANASTRGRRDKPPPPTVDPATRVAAVKAAAGHRKEKHRG